MKKSLLYVIVSCVWVVSFIVLPQISAQSSIDYRLSMSQEKIQRLLAHVDQISTQVDSRLQEQSSMNEDRIREELGDRLMERAVRYFDADPDVSILYAYLSRRIGRHSRLIQSMWLVYSEEVSSEGEDRYRKKGKNTPFLALCKQSMCTYYDKNENGYYEKDPSGKIPTEDMFTLTSFFHVHGDVDNAQNIEGLSVSSLVREDELIRGTTEQPSRERKITNSMLRYEQTEQIQEENWHFIVSEWDVSLPSEPRAWLVFADKYEIPPIPFMEYNRYFYNNDGAVALPAYYFVPFSPQEGEFLYVPHYGYMTVVSDEYMKQDEFWVWSIVLRCNGTLNPRRGRDKAEYCETDGETYLSQYELFSMGTIGGTYFPERDLIGRAHMTIRKYQDKWLIVYNPLNHIREGEEGAASFAQRFTTEWLDELIVENQDRIDMYASNIAQIEFVNK